MLLTACNPSNPAPEGNGWDFKVVTEMHPAKFFGVAFGLQAVLGGWSAGSNTC